MAYFLAPSADARPQFFTSQGAVLAGGFMYWYAATTTTPQDTFTDSTNGIANTNPIELDSAGRPKNGVGIYLTEGLSYKLVLKDSAGNTIFTQDNIVGITTALTNNEWASSGLTPTYIGATQFSFPGDQTTDAHKDRRVKIVDSGGTKYGKITASAFTTLTTVTVALDGGASLANPLASVSFGIIRADNPSVDNGVLHRKGAAVTSATTTDIWGIVGDFVHVTGTTTITSFGTAPYAGAERTVVFDGVLTITHNATTLQCPGSANILTEAGGRAVVRADTTANMIITSYSRADGTPVVNAVRPNLLINPNWLLDQINEGALYTVNTTDVRGPDGWSGTAVGAGVFKLRTLADPDNAALKCLEITCTTADAAIGAADDYFIYSAIEGYDAAALMAGTSSAAAITVQFKFKTAVTGVYGISVANSAINRRYIGSITVADTSEHEYSVALTMDTTGTWLYTNGVGCYLRLCLAAGSNFQNTAGAWAAGAEQTTSSQCNFMSVNTNIAYLKRIQLIPGSVVQPYAPADIHKELAKAQRQYFKSWEQGVAIATTSNIGASRQGAIANALYFNCPYKVTMRAVPTATIYSPVTGATGNIRNETTGADVAATANATYAGSDHVHLSVATAGANDVCTVHIAASARLS